MKQAALELHNVAGQSGWQDTDTDGPGLERIRHGLSHRTMASLTLQPSPGGASRRQASQDIRLRQTTRTEALGTGRFVAVKEAGRC